MGRPRDKEPRVIKSINVSFGAYEMCIKKGISIADTCSAALERAAFGDITSTDPLERERERIAMEAKALEKREQEVAVLQAQHDMDKQKLVDDFLITSDSVVNDDQKMAYWVQKTSLPLAELKALKFKKITSEIGKKKIDQEQVRLRQEYLKSLEEK